HTRFADYHIELLGFVGFIGGLVNRTDEVSRIIIKALQEHGTSKDRLDEETYNQRLKDGGGATKVYKRYGRLLFEIVMVRATDNFLTYVSELLFIAFKTRPEMLKSSETIRIDEVL